MALKDALAVRHHSYGAPAETVAVEPIPVLEPGEGEVVVALRRAVINPSDIGMIAGSYGRLRALPAIAGREGVGEVVALGKGVENVRLGALVRFPEEPGVWREAGTFKASELTLIPDGVPPEQAAMAFVNALTAYKLLDIFAGGLNAGDWVVQNAAGSALGVALIQLCRARGLRTLNVVRDLALEKPLRENGADVVVAEDSDYFKRVKELTGGGAVRLGINTVGGKSVIQMIKAAGESATIVTLGGASSEPVRFPTRFLIFNDLRLRGFWMDKWNRTHAPAERAEALGGVFRAMASGALKMPIAQVFPLAQIKEALACNAARGRFGKVQLSADWRI